ncbi:MAG TPA: tetratricopeptide repeat protein [Bryobacteraceae bacterium]|jgi:Flp pilus assembly protein TadD
MTAKTESPLSGASFVRTFAAVALAILALFSIDTFLAKTERAESGVEAARFYAEGQHLLSQGKGAEAVERFRSALSVERDSQDYQLALGRALLAAGRSADAEVALNELLQQNPIGAATNLAMARVLAKEDKIEDAVFYYHRAIYGQWKEDAHANQLTARFELTDLLSRQNSKEALLAELLPLQNDAPPDIPTRKKLGHLFIDAGSPARAAATFRDILRTAPEDPEVHRGLGDAEFASGNYRTAQMEFLTALHLNTADREAQARLDLCDQVLELDPTQRGLSVEEQYQRSRKLVEQVMNDVTQCLGSAASGSAQELIKEVQDGRKKPVSAAGRHAAYEDNLGWADRLWQVRKTDCKQAIGVSEEPLALVLAMVGR